MWPSPRAGIVVLDYRDPKGSDDGIWLFDLATGERKQFIALDGEHERWSVGLTESRFALSPDGRALAACQFFGDGKTKVISGQRQTVWDLPGGTIRWNESVNTLSRLPTTFLSFDPSGAFLALARRGSRDVEILDAANGKELTSYHTQDWSQIGTLRSDGKRLLIGQQSGWVQQTGFPISPDTKADRRYGHAWNGDPFANRDVTDVGYSPDGTLIYSAGRDGVIEVRDADTMNQIRLWRGHEGVVVRARFLADGRHLVSAGVDRDRARFWDVATGREAAKLNQFDDGDWLVTTPDGFFDGSPAGREKVIYRVGGGRTVVPVDRFFQDFYWPGLLSRILKGERPAADVKLGEQKPPSIKLLSPKESGATTAAEIALEAEVTDEGGGIAGPWLVHNGTCALRRQQDRKARPRLEADLHLAAGPRREPHRSARRQRRRLLAERAGRRGATFRPGAAARAVRTCWPWASVNMPTAG